MQLFGSPNAYLKDDIFKSKVNKSSDSAMDRKIFEGLFSIYKCEWPSWSCDQNHLNKLTPPHMKFEFNHRSLKFGPYITYIASKPKAHGVITT